MQELEYLRSEMNQRINLLYEHPYKMLGNILLVWGGALVLLSAKQEKFMENPLILFLTVTIFFISVIVIYLVSKRESENLNQVFRIAMYIAIFYEKRPNSSIEKNGNFFWELATFKIMKDEIADSNKKQYYKIKNEYFGFSLIAVFIKIILISTFLYRNNFSISQYDYVLMIAVCIGYIAISLFLFLPEIYENSDLNPKKWFNTKKGHLKSFMEYAIETGYYTEEEAKERFGEDFYNEIYNNRCIICNNRRRMDLSKRSSL